MSWVLLAAGSSFLCGLISVLLLQLNLKKVQEKPNAGRKVMILRRLMLCFVWTSTALAFGASFSTTQLARTLQHTSPSSNSIVTDLLVIQGGASLQALQWLAASFSFFFSTGVSSIFVDIGVDQSVPKMAPTYGDVPDF